MLIAFARYSIEGLDNNFNKNLFDQESPTDKLLTTDSIRNLNIIISSDDFEESLKDQCDQYNSAQPPVLDMGHSVRVKRCALDFYYQNSLEYNSSKFHVLWPAGRCDFKCKFIHCARRLM